MHRRFFAALLTVTAVLALSYLICVNPHRLAAQENGTATSASTPATTNSADSTSATTPTSAGATNSPGSANNTTTTDSATTTNSANTANSNDSNSKAVQMLGGGPENIQLNKEEQRFVELTNKERKSRGLNELIVAPLLVKVAREKSQEMHDLNYWGHESPIPEKRTAMRRLLYYLPQPPASMLVGENLYYCCAGAGRFGP